MKIAKFIISLLALLSLQSVCKAQSSASLGLYNSVKGFGISLDFPSKDKDFKTITLYADMLECFVEQGKRVGVKANFSVNHVFYETSGLVPFKFHAGPGVSAGWCPDFGFSYGPMFALSGNVGCRAEFKTAGIALDLGFTLEVGGHIERDGGNAQLKWYRGGVYGFPAPELRIMWMFK